MTITHTPYLKNATRDLANYSSALRFEDLPADVIAHTKICILDSLGVGLYGASLPWTKIVAEMVDEEECAPRSTVYGQAQRTSPANAVLVNSTACHAYELDDIHKLSLFHPGSVAVPVSLALAEADANIDGKRLIAAIVAGYEVSIRVGMAAGQPLFYRGHHPQGTSGAFTGAATAANLLGLNAEQTLHAFGIAGSQAAGLMAAQEGSMVKRLHSGRAAQSGMYSALLARKGFTGIVDVLEVSYGGFLSAFSGEPTAELLTAGLGTVYELQNVGFKPYACVTSIHTALDGLRMIMETNMLTAEQIMHVDAALAPLTHLHCAWEYKSQGTTAAQMNIFYGLAAIAVYGDAFIAQYKTECLADPRIIAFIKKIDCTVDEDIRSRGAPARHEMRMKVTTKDGKIYETYEKYRRGSPDNPLGWEGIERKFRLLAKECMDDGRADRIVELVKRIDTLKSLGELTKELGAR